MTLDATIGSETMNSYPTVQEADNYFENRVYASDSWLNFTDQESVLITCSQMLDWYIPWKGFKVSNEQPLQWPRTGVILPSGDIVSELIIPREIKTAVFELSLSFLEEDRTGDNPLSGLEQVKVGSLMVKVSQNQSKEDVLRTAKEVVPKKVWKIINGLYTRSAMGSIRLIRG